jgi:2-polyprenyl-3-methyl-5-hydroxy-6-metoxy-1,4-benzoquinol methylase
MNNFFEKIIKKIPYIRKIITFIYPVTFALISYLSIFFAKLTSFLYYLQMKLDWGKVPATEWMDHDQDTFYQFNSNGSFLHLERGILARKELINFLIDKKEFETLKINKRLNILDLCSGDSYISQKFFFDCSKIIVSIDIDPKALQRGKKRLHLNDYMNKNHFFCQSDIEKETIKNLLINNNLNIKFDFVLFNAAIEHFKENQLDFIFKSVKEVMNSKSMIFSYTIVEDENNQHYLPDHHEMFFKDKLQLDNLLKKYFKFTKSFETLINKRWNIYCVASDEKN